MAKENNLEDEIRQISEQYSAKNKPTEKDEAYSELLVKYQVALKKIEELEVKQAAVESNKMPTKEDIDAMSGMLDLINKLDDSTIEKLNKFGNKK